MLWLPVMTRSMSFSLIQQLASGESTEKMPVLFLGHGSPMNAIEDNPFVRGFRDLKYRLPEPKAILCISAHWETRGTLVTAMEHPRTIHDFGGFPQALYEVKYPAPGSPELAATTKQIVRSTTIGLDDQWGLDHGAWTVIKHLYPEASVPVVQLSLDYTKPPGYHYQLAKELALLRQKGVLIIGSGNLVHNLGLVAWNQLNTDDYAFDWASSASAIIKSHILNGNHQALVDYRQLGREVLLAIPTPEHFLPLLYVLGLQEKNEAPELFNDKAVAGSLTMTSVALGLKK
ncbi:MAG: 4,5-DOPA dioxygenase extradiol [Chitinophagales bacterium]